MKKLKSFFSMMLVLIVAFAGGCSVLPDNKDNTGLIEITDMTSKMSSCISMDLSGENILFLNMENDAVTYNLTIVNAERNKIVASKKLTDCGLNEVWGAKFNNENEIIVYDENAGEGITYDLDLKKTGKVDYKPDDYEELAAESEFIDGSFGIEDTYAVAFESDKTICVFYDEPETAYVVKDGCDQILGAYSKNMLCLEYVDDGSRLKLSVNDFKNELCINEIMTEKRGEGVYTNVLKYAIADNYVYLVLEYSRENGASISIPYIWKYSDSPLNTAFEIKRMTDEDFSAENNNLINDIKDKYTINVIVDEKPSKDKDEDEYGYEITYGVNSLELNLLLTKLSDTLALFPDNFFVEMYEGLEEPSDFEMHIVKNISNAGAYASHFDAFLIRFAEDSFNSNVVFHELMHLMYVRIYDYYYNKGQDFYDMWNELNEDNFFYGDENADFDENYFVSDYAMTNCDEDMADTFQYICESAVNEENPDWMQYEHVNKKAVFLCESIRKAFPSVAKTEEAFWEKYIK